jgi:hypothetical protein
MPVSPFAGMPWRLDRADACTRWNSAKRTACCRSSSPSTSTSARRQKSSRYCRRRWVTRIRQAPLFGQLQAVAQSAVHDAVITGSMPVPTPAMATVGVPTVVMRGGRTWPQLATAGGAPRAMLPHARLQIRRPRPRACLHCHDDPQLRQLRWHGFVPKDKALPMLAGALARLSLLHDEPNYLHSRPTQVLEYMASGVPVVSTANPSSESWSSGTAAGCSCPSRTRRPRPPRYAACTRTPPARCPGVERTAGRAAALLLRRGRQGLRRPDRGVGRRAAASTPA